MNNIKEITAIILLSLTTAKISNAAFGLTGNVADPHKVDLRESQNAGATHFGHDPLVENDPRTKVKEDVIALYPQLKSVAMVNWSGDNSSLTGTLVTKCHVLINLHLLSPAENSANLPGNSATKNVLDLSDDQLKHSPLSLVTLGFLPNGRGDFRSGFDVHLTGRIVKTGRLNSSSNFNYKKEIPSKEDWALVRLDNSEKLSKFSPIEIASEEEIATKNDAVLVGYPGQLLSRYGQNLFWQKCIFEPNPFGIEHGCIVTGGNSSSPLLARFTTRSQTKLKITGIAKMGKQKIDPLTTVGVPARSYRTEIEIIEKTEPCN